MKIASLGKAVGVKHSNYGKFGADHNRSKRYIVTTPEGVDIEVVGLRNFCRKNSLTYGAMGHLCVSTRRKTHKGGWKCRFG